MTRFSTGGPPVREGLALAVARVLAALLATFAVLVALLYSGYLNYTEPQPPESTTPHEQGDPTLLRIDPTGRRLVYDRSFARREGKLWHLHLEGSPEDIGRAKGQLTSRMFRRLDDQVEHLLHQRYPSWTESWSALMMLRWNHRGVDSKLAPSDRAELSAMAASYPERASGGLQNYHRLLLYQCFPDIARRLEDVVVQGTMLALSPKGAARAAGTGSLLVGRSLSIELGQTFEPDRFVSVHHPDGAYPFVSIDWPGMIGVVTGVNARGIVVAQNAARTDEPDEDGVPVGIVLRRVLERADTLEQAVEMVRTAELRTAGIVLIGDGVQRKAVIVELAPRDPEERRLVRGIDESAIFATNHMILEAFERDAQNDWIRRHTASGARAERLGELIRAVTDPTPAQVAAILRDRRGPGHHSLGLGNRTALEDLAVSQSVVIDATAMILWVAEGPSTLGRYRAFDLHHLLRRRGTRPAPLEDLPADPLLFSEEYRDFEEALASLAYARDLLTAGDPERALAAAKMGAALAPDLGDLHRTLGDIERELGHAEEARVHYRRYLELMPSRLRDRVRVEGTLSELGP